MKKIEYNIVLEYMVKILLFLMPMATLGIKNLQFNVLLPLLLIVAIVQIYKNGLKISFYEKYMLLFIGVILISLFFTKLPIELGLKQGKNFLWLLFLPTLFGQVRIKDKYYKYSFISMLIGSLILYKSFLEEIQKVLSSRFGIIEPLYKIISAKNMLLLQKLGTSYRLSGKYRYIALTGNALTIIIIITVIVLLEKKMKKIYKVGLVGFLIPTLYFLALTQSRAAYLSLAITLLIYLTYTFRKKILQLYVIIIGVFFVLFNFFKDNVYIVRAKNIFKFDNSNIGRLEVYKESLNLFKNNPLTGVGYENFIIAQDKTKYKMHKFYYHSHNMSLKLLSELGIIGFLAYYIWMFQILKNLFIEKEQLIKKIVLLVLINCLIFENFEILVITKTIHSILFLLIAFGINSNYIRYERKV